MSDVRWAEVRPCEHSDCARFYVLGEYAEHFDRTDLLALADDLAAILDTDGYVPKHARAAS